MPASFPIPSAASAIEAHCLRAARLLGLAVSAIGLGVLLGWTFHLLPLMTVLPGLVTMKANTAVCFALAGISLFLLSGPEQSAGRQKASGLLAAVMALLGALTLAEYLSGHSLGLDELLFKDLFASAAPGRMAPLSALNFCAIGLALGLLQFPRRTGVAPALAGAVAFNCLLAILGCLYGVDALYRSGRFTAVALHTSVAFLLLCAGIWLVGHRTGFMRVVTNAHTSGLLVRRYGPAAVILPLVIGWLRVQAVRLGWCSVEVGVVIVALANAVSCLTLVWIGAWSVRAAERRQARAQQGLRESEEKYRSLFNSIDTGFCVIEMLWDGQGRPADYRFIEVNPAFEGPHRPA